MTNGFIKELDDRIKKMMYCKKCGNISIIKVATSDGIIFYSCITEKCEDEAMLLLDIGDGEFVRYNKIYETFMKVVNSDETNKTGSKKSETEEFPFIRE